MKNKSQYKFNYISRYHSAQQTIVGKWEIIKRFIRFLFNREMLQIEFTKINNAVISENQTWEYNDEYRDYQLVSDLTKPNWQELRNKDKEL